MIALFEPVALFGMVGPFEPFASFNMVGPFKDVRANCFWASLLRTQFTATSCIERARCWRNVEIYSASGHFSIYARV